MDNEKGKRQIESHIANWYRNQVVFITGSTGFMGKVNIYLQFC